MALMYPWATKEYLLWEMSLGQIVMYHNLGIEVKYGNPSNQGKPEKLADMSYDELVKVKQELRQQYGDIG